MAKAPETAKFIDSLYTNPAQVSSTLGQVLREELPRPSRRDTFVVFEMMGWTVDHHRIRTAAPSWMSPIGVFSLASELSSESLWESLLSKADPGIAQGVAQELYFDPPGRTLARNNAKFITSAITLGLLGAAIGTTVNECSQPNDSSPLNTAFASEIGQRYQTPATDIDEYVQRVLELIPNPDVTKADGEGTLLQYLIKNNAFERPRKPFERPRFEEPKNDNRCPAIYLTRLLLEQWGRQLHTDDVYRERFRTTVLNGI